MDLAAVALVVAAVSVGSGWQPATAQDWPVRHSVHFQAADDGWSNDRYPSSNPSVPSDSRRYDQRGATIGVDPIRTAQAPTWPLDRAEQAAADTGTALQNAGREFGQQLQNMTGLGGQSSPPPPSSSSSTSLLRSPPSSQSSQSSPPSTWPAPPPLASSPQTSPSPTTTATNRSTTPDSWSIIRPEFAPPRLPTPPLANTNRLAGNPALGRESGPAFPSLSDDRTATTPDQRSAEPNWSTGWGSASAPNSSANDDDSSVGLVPVPPRVRTNTTTQPQAAAIPPATNNAADAWANFGTQPSATPNNPPPDRYSTQPQTPLAAAPPSLPADQPGIGTQTGQATIGVAPPANQVGSPAHGADEVPWKPLLAVSLALAGSLGANLFLGWSYADARHRYRSLVEKTTHSFQKAAGLAA